MSIEGFFSKFVSMETLIHKELSEKIKNLPQKLVEELSEYLEFLIYKNNKDWVEQLSPEQKKTIDQGLDDIEKQNIYDHDAVMEEMAQYIKSKKG